VKRYLALVLVLSFALRVVLAWRVPSIHQADEVYQVAEQAHRAEYSYGLESWEFKTAARGAFFAVMVKPIFMLDASPTSRQVLVGALFAAFSLLPIWVAFHWTRRIHGEEAGLLAAILTATWFELIYFGPKPTADAFGGYLLIAGLYFARFGDDRRQAMLSGFLLLVALGARMQIAPAIAVALGVAAFYQRRDLAALAAGAAAGVVLVGLMEWSWWGVPFLGH
jgi:hypothetical protein